jgi:hypothetical protein
MNLNFNEKIEQKIHIYINQLLELWEANPEIENCINCIYFNSKLKAKEILNNAEIKNFFEYNLNLNQKFEIGVPEELKNNNLFITKPVSLEGFDIFDFFETDSLESALSKKNSNYYLVRKKYYKSLDNILLSIYSDYSKIKTGIYRKVISDKLSIDLDFKSDREQIDDFIHSYTFPCVIVNYNNEIYQLNADVRNLIFIRGQSFMLFNLWAKNYLFSEFGQVMKVENKDDEPIIYELQGKYRVCNSGDKIELWNAIISTLVNLHILHFRVFEKWLIDTLVD